MKTRLALALALSSVAVTAGIASAADAPKTSATSSTFFLSQEGCGTTAEPGRLEPKANADGATGCGTIGGLPFNEALTQLGEDMGEDFTTGKRGVPITLDASKKITGQLAAESWIGAGAGAGEVSFDVAMFGTDAKGKSIDFGSTTVSGAITPGDNVVMVPFTLNVPATAANAVVKALTMHVSMRGANLGFSAKHLDGDSYVVIPTKKK